MITTVSKRSRIPLTRRFLLCNTVTVIDAIDKANSLTFLVEIEGKNVIYHHEPNNVYGKTKRKKRIHAKTARKKDKSFSFH